MTDQPDLPFDVVFGDDGLALDARGAVPLAPGDLAGVFAATAGVRVGSHLDAGPGQPRFDGDTSELPPEVCWALQELVAAPARQEAVARALGGAAAVRGGAAQPAVGARPGAGDQPRTRLRVHPAS